MGVVNMDAANVVQSCVEAMLLRFSDPRLGMVVGVDMGLSDNGYGKEGTTKERSRMSVRRWPWFLFVRPDNYTKVYFWLPGARATGSALSPFYAGRMVWTEIADHDSCWRDAVETELVRLYFDMAKSFEGRTMGKEMMRPCDICQHVGFRDSTPCLVRLERLEPANPKAERFTPEARPHNVSIVRIEWKDVESDAKSRLKLKG